VRMVGSMADCAATAYSTARLESAAAQPVDVEHCSSVAACLHMHTHPPTHTHTHTHTHTQVTVLLHCLVLAQQRISWVDCNWLKAPHCR
jgi:hypothetical protein